MIYNAKIYTIYKSIYNDSVFIGAIVRSLTNFSKNGGSQFRLGSENMQGHAGG